MNSYSCCNLSVRLPSLSYRVFSPSHCSPLFLPVRRLHRPRLSRHTMHRVHAEPRRHARKVPPRRQHLHGLLVCVVLYAVRLNAAGQGGGVSRAECAGGTAGESGRDGLYVAVAGAGVSTPVKLWVSRWLHGVLSAVRSSSSSSSSSSIYRLCKDLLWGM
jgi:hypothetical protein